MSETFEHFCWRNIIVIVAALLTLGGIFYAVRTQGENIKSQEVKIIDLFRYRTELKIEQARSEIKLDIIQQDLIEMKSDLKYIRQNLNGKQNDTRDATKIAKSSF